MSKITNALDKMIGYRKEEIELLEEMKALFKKEEEDLFLGRKPIKDVQHTIKYGNIKEACPDAKLIIQERLDE